MSRFSNESFHVGSQQYESNKRASEKQRQMGFAAGNGSSLSERPLAERQEALRKLMAKNAEEKRLSRNAKAAERRKSHKGSAIHNALNKHKQ